MTSRGTEPLPMAPYSVELLADLHAGVLPESVSTKLWPLVEADADARRILASLDAVSARLRAVGADLDGGESMPPDVAERIDRTLAGAGNAGSTGPARGLPRSVRPLLIAAAASIVIAVATTLFVRSASTSEPDVVAGPGEESVLTLQSSLIDDSVVQSVMANRDPVQLVEAGLLPDCLQANGIDRNSVVLGAAAVDIDGSEGTMLVLSRGPDAGLTVLAVGAGCGVDDPQPLFRRDLS
ncbi:hypothetical protein HQ346_09375 [Rhodococcus sp. BP-252]|uniref:hypothetical protein n=1 Tax=unclassified Rhodococcus (in: high G+C Gram-positive bacteria) TaxID=192944 RepID=UPI001431F115|nr:MULTISPECIES: hypothetical protein [unclassified Rhodococcus (in: high G+C Gram-positive bacteria)]MBY6411942.1 hypothetical protein [Rhodococcus sp. BP-320]MBY6416430.1 hypothetical protein [Rhodococcus sp. BP-321]MBY6420764.1 hypothetical protein [Rhodococcus sp. BP-324]MBY6426454.1 hypothetical protein [Rhodococcus sp. BP-323]MBY6431453.1 hypothetical protein [Rhodococcus sp. BP-322]